jgi:hypothetical protein
LGKLTKTDHKYKIPSIWLLFCKKSEKNLGMFHFLEFFRAETK